jgi:hypothetical protein
MISLSLSSFNESHMKLISLNLFHPRISSEYPSGHFLQFVGALLVAQHKHGVTLPRAILIHLVSGMCIRTACLRTCPR